LTNAPIYANIKKRSAKADVNMIYN